MHITFFYLNIILLATMDYPSFLHISLHKDIIFVYLKVSYVATRPSLYITKCMLHLLLDINIFNQIVCINLYSIGI